MENLENNKLIAEFMDVFPRQGERRTGMKEFYSAIDLNISGLPDELTLADDLDFEQWQWLMPVVEKIESLNFEIDGVITSADVHIVYGDCRIVDEDGNGLFEFYSHSTDSGDKLVATYKAVVEFIKWYNQKQ